MPVADVRVLVGAVNALADSEQRKPPTAMIAAAAKNVRLGSGIAPAIAKPSIVPASVVAPRTPETAPQLPSRNELRQERLIGAERDVGTRGRDH